MDSHEGHDTLHFMQGQTAALEIMLRAIIESSPALKEALSTAAGRLAGELAKDAPASFSAGWYHTLRRLNGGSFPVVGSVPD
jgi:hypothetical protein